MISKEDLLNKMQTFSYQNWRNATLLDNTKSDKTPQFEQDADNCWLYSMFNNAYYNFNSDFSLSDVIEVKNRMKSDWVNIKWGNSSITSGCYIAEYLTEKRDTSIKHFQIDFLKDPKWFIDLINKWYALEMSRFNNPALYADAHDDGSVNQIYHPFDAKGWHSVNIIRDWKFIRELWTRWEDSNNNTFLYEPYMFWMNCKTRAISSIFTFLAPVK